MSLADLVAVANEVLPEVLPKDASGRVVEEVNPRLVRHYTTQGLLPDPRKDGREARYLFEHLLKLLVVRRLMAEGFSSQAIKQLVSGLDDERLIEVLQGGVEVRLVPAAAGAALSPEQDQRLAFLAGVRRRAGLEPGHEEALVHGRGSPNANAPRPPAATTAAPPGTSESDAREPASPTVHPKASPRKPAKPGVEHAFAETSWTSFTVAEGLELFVRSDFSLPATRLGDEQLLELIKLMLLNLEQRRRSRP